MTKELPTSNIEKPKKQASAVEDFSDEDIGDEVPENAKILEFYNNSDRISSKKYSELEERNSKIMNERKFI